MKKHSNNRKLLLNKTTIAILTRREMQTIKGGSEQACTIDCDPPPTDDTNKGNISD